MGDAADDESDLAALVAGASPPPARPPPPPPPVPTAEPAVAGAAAAPATVVRTRSTESASARYLPLPAARLIDQWSRFAASAEEGVGLLFVAARTTPVHAISAGTVKNAPDGDPHRLALEDEDGRLYLYGCLVAEDRTRSKAVAAGDVIGRLDGDGPRLRLPYLEIGIREPDGRWCNPYEVLLGLPDADELTVLAAEEGLAVDPDAAYRAPTAAPVAPPEPEVTDVDEPEEVDEPVEVDEVDEPEPEPEPEPEAPADTPPATAADDDDDLLNLLVAPPDPRSQP